MNILILRSIPRQSPQDPYVIRLDTAYARRVIGHLTDPGYCSACGKKCISCRQGYALDFKGSISAIIDFPAVLPAVLDDPGEFLPKTVPEHDVLLAISVNEEVLTAFLERFSVSAGVIIPVEDPDWISPHGIQKISDYCNRQGMAAAFPRPFCSFDPRTGILKEFKETFKIGKPELDYTIKGGTITAARVKTSAPCGATYHTARGLVGKTLDQDLAYIIDNRLSAYPCTASTAVDRESGDSLIHRAVKVQRDILRPLSQSVRRQRT